MAGGCFVASGMLAPEEFHGRLVPVANALPGLVKAACGLGHSFGTSLGGNVLGLAFAALALAISSAVSVGACLLCMPAYGRIAQSVFMHNLGTVIPPVICGLLLTTMMSMLNASMEIAEWASVSPTAVGWASLAGAAVLP